jgi:hypothetical protein
MTSASALLISISIGSFFIDERGILETSLYPADYGLVRIEVGSYPDSLLPAGASALELIPIRAADANEFLAAAVVEGGWLVLDTLVTSDMIFNEAKSWAWWDSTASTLTLGSQLPFRMYTYNATWHPFGSDFGDPEEWEEDPSEEALSDTQDLLDSGRVEEAVQRLYDIFYPQWYFDGNEMAARFLSGSYYEAQRMADAGDWAGALGTYLCAGDAYDQCGLDPEWFLDAHALGADGNPLRLWMDTEVLQQILGHLSAVADQAGDPGTASRAREAALALFPAPGSPPED